MKVRTAGEKRLPDIDTSEISRTTSGLGSQSWDRWRKFRQKADAEAGRDHHLNPVLALALKAHLHAEPALMQPVGEIVAVLAIDPSEIRLAGNVRNADAVLLPVGKAMQNRSR